MIKLFSVIAFFAIMIKSPYVLAEEKSVCGLLKLGDRGLPVLVLDQNGKSAYISKDSRISYAQYGKLEHNLYKFTGNRVCLSDSTVKDHLTEDPLFEMWTVATTVKTEISIAPDFRINDIQATHCEIFIDKAAMFYVDGYNMRSDHYASRSLKLFIKVLPDRLDGKIRAVRYYHLSDHYMIGSPFEAVDLKPWLGSIDYYYLTIPDNFWETGSFYVETENNTRYWYTQESMPYSNFKFDGRMMNDLERHEGFFGYKYPQHGPDLDVGQLGSTADLFPYLNPQRCR